LIVHDITSKHHFCGYENSRGGAGLPMTDARAAGLPLVGGVLAFDFANTAAGRDGAEPIEHLASADDLAAWAAHAGVLARAPAAALRTLEEARRLREAIHGLGSALARGEAPHRADLRTIRDVARRALAEAELIPNGGGYALDFSKAPATLALLGPIAWSAVDLLRQGGFDRVKQCPAPGCGWLFLDRSKNNSRRWCDMATCGNRSKAKRHRERW
jgi:predicted RNA-binding Zn ribbon-like protein